MKKPLPVVHCVYAEDGKNLPEVIEASFRSYLTSILATADKKTVQYL